MKMLLAAMCLVCALQCEAAATHKSHEKDSERHAVADLLRALTGSKQGTPALTQDQKDTIVAFHNAKRQEVGASDMQKIKWNTKLAELAQDWANRCLFCHRGKCGKGTYVPADYGFPAGIGENMWKGGKTAAVPDGALQSFYGEKINYVHPEPILKDKYCKAGGCGHYTQMVWANTTDVGCGYAVCDSITVPPEKNSKASSKADGGVIVVCDYGPPGNYIGVIPYTTGDSCTTCKGGTFFCTDGLCDSTCTSTGTSSTCACNAQCQNCGTVSTSTCSCECKPGWMGGTCTEECRDKDSQCNPPPYVSGWPPKWCGAEHQYVLDGCPLMCGTCKPSDGSVCNKKSGKVSRLSDREQKKKHLFHLKHTINSKQAAPALTQAQIDGFVAQHNAYRNEVGASNMQKMKWNPTLAALAQDWANMCIDDHRPEDSYDPTEYGFPSIGESIYTDFNKYPSLPDGPMQGWYSEKGFYVNGAPFGESACVGGECGHYTQMIWADTTDVGCGYAICSSGANVVCNYGPIGNVPGAMPYTAGAPCTTCKGGSLYCTDGLCDSTCTSPGTSSQCSCNAECENCGTVSTSTCSCECKPGWMGPSCSDECKDLDSQCNPQYGDYGWYEDWCDAEHQYVLDSCPLMCGTCKPSDGSVCNKKSRGKVSRLSDLESKLKHMLDLKHTAKDGDEESSGDASGDEWEEFEYRKKNVHQRAAKKTVKHGSEEHHKKKVHEKDGGKEDHHKKVQVKVGNKEDHQKKVHVKDGGKEDHQKKVQVNDGNKEDHQKKVSRLSDLEQKVEHLSDSDAKLLLALINKNSGGK